MAWSRLPGTTHHSVKIQLPPALGGGNMGTLPGAGLGLAGQWRVIIDWGN